MKLRINFGHFRGLCRLRFRTGFTLVELLISMLIFAMMMSALATIYGTISRHMFQNYKQNILKTNLSVAVKFIQSRLMLATRVDSPAFTKSDNVLAFTTNVDAQSGCSPINFLVPNKWHYFCRAYNGKEKYYDLYHHTGDIAKVNTTGGCPASAGHSNEWIGKVQMDGRCYPIAFCGKKGGGEVTKILENVQLPLSGFMFSRASDSSIKKKDRVREIDQVRVTVRTKKTIDDGRPIDVSLDTVVHTQTTIP